MVQKNSQDNLCWPGEIQVFPDFLIWEIGSEKQAWTTYALRGNWWLTVLVR